MTSIRPSSAGSEGGRLFPALRFIFFILIIAATLLPSSAETEDRLVTRYDSARRLCEAAVKENVYPAIVNHCLAFRGAIRDMRSREKTHHDIAGATAMEGMADFFLGLGYWGIGRDKLAMASYQSALRQANTVLDDPNQADIDPKIRLSSAALRNQVHVYMRKYP